MSLQIAAGISGIVTIASATSFAQQPPAWSPQPFAKPAQPEVASSEAPIPHNSLRAEKPAADEPVVLRWKPISKEKTPASEKSFAQSFDNASRQQIEVKPQGRATDTAVIRQPQSVSTKPPATTDERTAAEPRSGFQTTIARTTPSSTIQLASYTNESVESVAKPVSQASNGVWYDRSNPSTDAHSQGDRLVLGAPNGNTMASQDHSATQNAQTRQMIQKARFQEAQGNPLELGNQLGLPPVQPQLPPASNETLANPTLQLPNAPDAEPPRMQAAPPQQNRSLLPPEEVPNPFPGSKKQQSNDERSPSDNIEPPTFNPRKDLDRAPAPPRRSNRSLANCDNLRQLVNESDIKNIKINSSPEFIEGYKSKGRGANNSKEAFIKSAPIRTWYDLDGAVIADGKLLDLTLGTVVLEKADGTRTSILMRKLSEADRVYVSDAWGMPITCSVDDGSFPRRDFTDTTVTWKASGACHKPLYFEEVQLERYGHEWGPFAQPAISTAHFFGSAAVLPYKMGIHPMNECQYSLGYYRPGSCAPWTVGPVPISLRGALFQAKAVTGAVLAIP